MTRITMYPSRTISFTIGRPYSEVYGFLSQPRNLSRWTKGLLVGPIEPVGPNVWRTDFGGEVVDLHFTPDNAYGVLDLEVRSQTKAIRRYYVRLFPNGEGAELCVTVMQRAGESDVEFQSEVEWLRSDLGILKSYLE
ncbi:hypothetical protein [Devosia sp. XK-2]|uniref:hypothetical protein n=1 Tax=Devosia sp. XK-2 TaxID=3126689 RepID=UPI0030D62710